MKCLNFNFQELFFRFRFQGSAIGSKVTKNGIFETFCLKAFSVEKLEMPFLEYKSLNVSRRVSRSCFFKFLSYRLSIVEKVRENENFENKSDN